jgi:hypothetical protein
MKPFYSVDDLEGMFDFSDVLNIADALRAANVPLIYEGQEADLSGWRGMRPQVDSDGAIQVMRFTHMEPDPDNVMVSFETLPDSWRRHIADYENSLKAEQPDRDKPLATRTRTNLLKLIAALCKAAKIDLATDKGATTMVMAALSDARFDSPDEKTTRRVLKEAAELPPDLLTR